MSFFNHLLSADETPIPPFSSDVVHYVHAGLGIVKDGSNKITSWTDSVTGTVWTVPGTTKPAYMATGLNGKPAVSYFQTRFKRPSSLALGNAYTIFELSENESSKISLGGTGYTQGYFLVTQGAEAYHWAGSNYISFTGAAASVETGYTTKEIVRSATQVELTIDGVSKGVVSIPSTAALTVSAMGDFDDTTMVSPYRGKKRVQLVYNRTLTAEERATVRAFLNAQK